MKAYLIFAIVLLAVLFAGSLYVWHLKSENSKALETQKIQLTEECTKAQAKTEKADAQFKADNDDLKQRLHALQLHHPSECVHTTSGTNDTNSRNGHAGPDVASAWLLDYAAECEGYRRAVVTLQQFIQDERQ